MQLLCSIVFHLPFSISAITYGIGPVVGWIAGWIRWRDKQLRRRDVLEWSNQAIAAMETLFLICRYGNSLYDEPGLDKKIKELCISTAILVEQGRLFFKNQPANGYGSDKEAAYRGYRPRILDPLVVAHKIALCWPNANPEDRVRMCIVAEKYLKKFVSLCQKEVGRSRTASAGTRESGDSINLRGLMTDIDQEEIQKFLSADQR